MVLYYSSMDALGIYGDKFFVTTIIDWMVTPTFMRGAGVARNCNFAISSIKLKIFLSLHNFSMPGQISL